MTAESTTWLQEAIADVLADGGPVEDEADAAAAVIDCLRERRDEVLAALGIKRFGWMEPCFNDVHGERTHAGCEDDPPCVVVYIADDSHA